MSEDLIKLGQEWLFHLNNEKERGRQERIEILFGFYIIGTEIAVFLLLIVDFQSIFLLQQVGSQNRRKNDLVELKKKDPGRGLAWPGRGNWK